MKSIFLILITVFFSISCTKNDNNNQETTIIGSWKLIEAYGSDGGEGSWQIIENGYNYEFKESGLLLSNRFNCDGTFEIDESLDHQLNISFQCDDTQFQLSHQIIFEAGNLILWNSLDCDEGCGWKFKRVQSE